MTNPFRDEIIALVGVILAFLAILVAAGRKDVIIKIKKNTRDPWFWIFSILVMGFSIWGLNQDTDPTLKVGIHHGLTALIASYFSYLSLVFPAFFIAAIVAYFSLKRFT